MKTTISFPMKATMSFPMKATISIACSDIASNCCLDASLTLLHGWGMSQERCVIVTNNGQGGPLPKVEDRGSDLDGSSYAALGSTADSRDLKGAH